MKRILALLSVVIATAIAGLAWSFSAARLAVPEGLPAIALPTRHAPTSMQLYALPAGRMASRAMLAYRGGSFSDQRVFGMGGLLIRHPRGDLLVDAGFGRNVDAHVRTTPRLMQWTSSYTREPTVAEQLRRAGIEASTLSGVLLTHAHWDHVSGIEDLPGVPVWVNAAELGFVQSGERSAELARDIGTEDYRVYSFDDGAYLGFPRSHDMFGDGSVVVVPAPGHTPGSVIVFVHVGDGHRYALIGDLVWQKEGIDLPAERPWLSRHFVDGDPQAVRALIVHMHRLQAAMPELVIVPAHDRRVWETLPRLPAAR